MVKLVSDNYPILLGTVSRFRFEFDAVFLVSLKFPSTILGGIMLVFATVRKRYNVLPENKGTGSLSQGYANRCPLFLSAVIYLKIQKVWNET